MKMELTIENVNKLEKCIRKMQNSWAFYYDGFPYRYSFSVKNNIITANLTKYFGLVYSFEKVVDLSYEPLVKWFNQYKKYIA